MVSPELLKDVPFFEELPNSMLERLPAIAEIKTGPKDDYLNFRDPV